MKLNTPFLFGLVSVLAACGGADAGGGSATSGVGPGGGKMPAGDAGGVAAGCGLSSGYKGDEMCIPPPNPGEGIQIHAGPKNYDDPTEVAPYLLGPGQENVQCVNAAIPESDFFYLKQENRMRPSSHHMLISVSASTGLKEGPSSGCDVVGSLASIPGSQTPERNFPDKLGPEDEGLGRYLPASTMAGFQLHYINTTTEPVLREAWVNLYKKDAASVTQRLQGIFMVGDFSVAVPPQTRQTTTLDFAPTLPSETRVFEMNAHMHAHSEAFTVWRGHAGTEDIIYQSFNWEDPYENTFNTVVQNPTPDPASHRDGGLSGLFYLEPGDTLRWACDVNNTLDTTLHFANEALTAEMCMLVGAYISPTSGLLAGGCANGKCAAGLGRRQ